MLMVLTIFANFVEIFAATNRLKMKMNNQFSSVLCTRMALC